MDDRQAAMTYPPQAPWITPEVMAHVERVADSLPPPNPERIELLRLLLAPLRATLIGKFFASGRRTT